MVSILLISYPNLIEDSCPARTGQIKGGLYITCYISVILLFKISIIVLFLCCLFDYCCFLF